PEFRDVSRLLIIRMPALREQAEHTMDRLRFCRRTDLKYLVKIDEFPIGHEGGLCGGARFYVSYRQITGLAGSGCVNGIASICAALPSVAVPGNRSAANLEFWRRSRP